MCWYVRTGLLRELMTDVPVRPALRWASVAPAKFASRRPTIPGTVCHAVEVRLLGLCRAFLHPGASGRRQQKPVHIPLSADLPSRAKL